MREINIASEVMGALVVLLILYGSLFEVKKKNKQRNAFIALIIANLVTIVADMITWLPVKWEEIRIVFHTMVLITYVAPFIAALIFILYIYQHISSKVQIKKFPFQIALYYTMIVSIITFILCITGNMYDIKNGAYIASSLYYIYMITYIILLIYLTLLIFSHTRNIGIHDTIAESSFCILPLIFIIINIFVPNATFSVAAMALDMLLIYIMLQSEHEDELLSENTIVTKLAHNDELTGLQNRLGYNEAIEAICSKNQPAGVVFCDLNGLKYTNDNMGHKAGDKMIIDFKNMLLTSFREEDIFRIGGDEFVILIPGIGQENFESRSRNFIKKIESENIPLASVGYSYGSSEQMDQLLDTAEKNMYAMKKLFYKKFPMFSRDKQ